MVAGLAENDSRPLSLQTRAHCAHVTAYDSALDGRNQGPLSPTSVETSPCRWGEGTLCGPMLACDIVER